MATEEARQAVSGLSQRELEDLAIDDQRNRAGMALHKNPGDVQAASIFLMTMMCRRLGRIEDALEMRTTKGLAS